MRSRQDVLNASDSHFVYGYDEVIVDLLGNDRIKFIRRMGSNKVACPGSWRLKCAAGATPDEAKVARDLAQFRLAHIERIDVRLDETNKSRVRVALPKSRQRHNQHSRLFTYAAVHDLVHRILCILLVHAHSGGFFFERRCRRRREAVRHYAVLSCRHRAPLAVRQRSVGERGGRTRVVFVFWSRRA